jgi:hypothetical protein
MERLVQQGSEDNGVWRMMVAASALHEQQQHNLDLLRKENSDLKNRIDGHYAKPEARLFYFVFSTKSSTHLQRTCWASGRRTTSPNNQVVNTGNIWSDFAGDIAGF